MKFKGIHQYCRSPIIFVTPFQFVMVHEGVERGGEGDNQINV